MNKALINIGINDYDFNNYKRTNNLIFNKEERIFKENKYYQAISLISVMLLDLGLIEY